MKTLKTFEDRLTSPKGLNEFRKYISEFSEEIEKVRKKCEDVLSTIKVKRVKAGRRKWAIKVLDGVTAVGVDGSQVKPLREFGIPAGAVQVAAYVVKHGTGEWNVSYSSGIVKLEDNVDATRYEMEMLCLTEQMDGKSCLFYDGSLSPSFAREMSKSLKARYERSARKAVERSEETKTPLFGYTDRSYAKDIAKDIYDSFLLSGMEIMSYTEPLEGDGVWYSYVRFSPSLPSRVEMPEWVARRFNRFAEVVCAECLLGSTYAYPFVLERAHRYAVIGEKERRMIAEILGGISLSFKWVSKL